MTFTPFYSMSFDDGDYDKIHNGDIYPDTSVVYIQTSQKKTGTSGLRITGWDFSAAQPGYFINRGVCGITPTSTEGAYDEVYFSFWALCNPGPSTSDTNKFRQAIRLYLDNGDYFIIHLNQASIRLYNSSESLLSGPSDRRWFPWWSWALWEVRMLSAVSGVIQVKVNGNLLIDYSGNTTGGSNKWWAVLWAASGYTWAPYGIGENGHVWYLDNIVGGTGGWPGDIRADSIVPNSDVSVTGWTPSTGGNVYAVVDEIPVSVSDYAYAYESSKSMELGHATWDDATGTKIPIGMHIRSYIERSVSSPSTQLQIDNGASNSQSAIGQLTGALLRRHMFSVDAGGTEWNTSKINNTNFGVTT